MRDNITVKNWMTSPVRTVECATSVADAYNTMMVYSIRRLPVVDHDKLVGIVTLGDLREARPSPASSLSIYELNYLLAKLTVEQVMTHNPYTVTPDAPLKEVATLMLERKVGGLPVIDDAGHPVGIITESDIFRMLVEEWDYFTGHQIDPGLLATLLAQSLNS
jgi:CBS domain-containing protein